MPGRKLPADTTITISVEAARVIGEILQKVQISDGQGKMILGRAQVEIEEGLAKINGGSDAAQAG